MPLHAIIYSIQLTHMLDDLCVCDMCKDGYTPLHRAAQYGHIDTVRCLLEAGAAVDSRDNVSI